MLNGIWYTVPCVLHPLETSFRNHIRPRVSLLDRGWLAPETSRGGAALAPTNVVARLLHIADEAEALTDSNRTLVAVVPRVTRPGALTKAAAPVAVPSVSLRRVLVPVLALLIAVACQD